MKFAFHPEAKAELTTREAQLQNDLVIPSILLSARTELC